jgi:copper chaperone CopZ
VCAHAVGVFMKRIDGVESVDVSLKEGAATIALRPGNHVTVDEIRDAIRKNGFTPKGADVTVAGKVIERNGKPALAVGGSDLVYLLAEGADAKGKLAELRKWSGKDVVVTGHLPESTGQRGEPQTLELRGFSAP